MKKKVIGVIVLLLVFAFPFRLAFLEYPANINVNNTLIDGDNRNNNLFLIIVVRYFIFHVQHND